jgi:energy-coupling factor transporter ATP-binding protein EcfA2
VPFVVRESIRHRGVSLGAQDSRRTARKFEVRLETTTSITLDGSDVGITGTVQFGRVTVILGVNGAGKTRLLQWLARATFPTDPTGGPQYRFWPTRNVLYIEGNRVIQFDRLRRGGSIETSRHLGRTAEFEVRLRSLFAKRARADTEADRVFQQALLKWYEGGQQGPGPMRDPKQIESLLGLLNAYFGELTWEWFQAPAEDGCLRVKRGGKQYFTNTLSEGEKQIADMIMDLSEAAQNTVFLVDEPELHLHPQQAESFWAGVEGSKPGAIFVYATHSLPFAMRDSVDTLIVLSRPGAPVVVLDSIDDLPADDVRQFLGAVPGVLKAGKALATEGEGDISVDREFYRWILGEPEAVVVSLGSCERVRKAVAQAGAWNSLAPHATVCGVIDRDYRPDDEIKAIEKECVVTTYHEVESYLCVPKLVAELSRVIDTAKRPVTESEVKDRIVEHCKAQLNSVVAQRVMQGLRGNFSFGMSAGGFNSMKKDDAIQAMQRRAEQSIEQLKKFSGEAIVKSYNSEENRCRRAILSGDVGQVLALFPVKGLVENWIAELLECRDVSAIVRGASNRLDIAAYPALFELRNALLKQWL